MMTHSIQTIAIILARQHSKGIPLKNLQTVGGISLLGRAILAAQDSQIFDKIIVSTDGEKIADEASKYPPITLIHRPDDLANDTATSISGVLHALDQLDIECGTACLLQPTSPLRTGAHIQAAFELFKQQNQFGSVISVCQAAHHPLKCLIQNEQGQFQAVGQLSDLESPRQQLPQAYHPNGAIYFNDISQLRQYHRFFNQPINFYPMNTQDSVDIDAPSDLIYANHILAHQSL